MKVIQINKINVVITTPPAKEGQIPKSKEVLKYTAPLRSTINGRTIKKTARKIKNRTFQINLYKVYTLKVQTKKPQFK